MKKLGFIILVLFLFSVVIHAEIKLFSVTGYVQIKENEEDDWIVAELGQKLQPGFIIYTGFNSTATIKTDDSTIEVKPLSQISIASLVKTSDSISTDVYLNYGKVKAEVDPEIKTQTLFKVRSANSTASVRGTVFDFGDDNLFVEDGTVFLVSKNGLSTLVQRNEGASASPLKFLVTPYQKKKIKAFVNSLPVGLSDSEKSIGNLVDSKITGRATVIIRINVVN